MTTLIETIGKHWVASLILAAAWIFSLDILCTTIHNIVVTLKSRR